MTGGAPPGEYIIAHPVTCDATSVRLHFAW